MRIFSIIAQLVATGLIIFNATHINLDAPFKNQSLVALITIVASAIVIVLLQILRLSKRIQKEQEKN